jgi:hypothetical protein
MLRQIRSGNKAVQKYENKINNENGEWEEASRLQP